MGAAAGDRDTADDPDNNAPSTPLPDDESHTT
jgi:hypothetical protein